MKPLNTTLPRLLAAAALLACAGLAQAQYMWIDEKGNKQLSDQPPPASIPLKNILKAPRGMTQYKYVPAPVAADAPASMQADGADAAPAAPAAAAKGPPTLAERNADFRKRAAEKALAETKAKEEATAQKAKKDNCENAQNYKRSLDSGERIGETNASGERGFMSDEKRIVEQQRAKEIIDACK
ncbi:DUF4124 domain-containing protein [Massilia glaciei]|uniref:DUF4124 domain-containing protein n=2 Tax=Massilia glaciei TaxID=1524097 RepID=A0A2U2HMN2_9BURK|nr:DUF4124 domain-containing protein [Massilia glaciei]